MNTANTIGGLLRETWSGINPATSHSLNRYNPDSYVPSCPPIYGYEILDMLHDVLKSIDNLRQYYIAWQVTQEDKSYRAFINEFWGEEGMPYLVKVLDTDLVLRTFESAKSELKPHISYEDGQLCVSKFYEELKQMVRPRDTWLLKIIHGF
jgi:hypothetical protein